MFRATLSLEEATVRQEGKRDVPQHLWGQEDAVLPLGLDVAGDSLSVLTQSQN